MKKFFGVLLINAGVFFGLYVGLYLCFVGGIISLITEVRAPELDAGTIAWAVVRIMFAGVAGFLSAYIFMIPGYLLFLEKRKSP